MKRILFTIITLGLLSNLTFAQCTELFISKYMRGRGNTKGVEFYNPTANPINLTAGMYSIERFKSAGTPGVIDNIMDDSLYLIGTVPAYGSFVLVNGQDSANSSGTSPQPDPDFQAIADQLDHLYGTYGTNVGQPMYFKGNDCLVLKKNGNIIDVFGEVNATVTTAWSTIAPYRGASGQGKWITTGFLMERKASIKDGRKPPVTNDLSSFTEFNPLEQWDTIPSLPSTATHLDSLDLFALFGSHNCDCATQGLNNKVAVSSASIFPNPANEVVLISSTETIKYVELYNSLGELVYSIEGNNNVNVPIDTKPFPNGLYFIKSYTNKGMVLNNKVVFE
ncbi:MAG TPA: lamin tail domain-containing protein [Bacteroidia bacterium]|nr:lamin tail domain-containing protein [Bacteroidia bacterium]